MLYENEYWTVKNQHEYKVSIGETRMLHRMCGTIIHNEIENDNFRESVEVTPIVKRWWKIDLSGLNM